MVPSRPQPALFDAGPLVTPRVVWGRTVCRTDPAKGGKVSVPTLPQFGIEGMVIGVTGTGHGIGRAIALRAMEAGADVFGCSRTEENLKSLAEEAHGLPGKFAYIALDISEAQAPKQFVDFGLERFGRVDGFVNNAGGNPYSKPALDYTVEEVDYLFDFNLRAVYFCCVEAARAMIDAGIKGSIVNLASKGALVAAPRRVPYGAIKAGLIHLSRSLAAEWAEHGIRVNTVSPGATASPRPTRSPCRRCSCSPLPRRWSPAS
jgi:NAD(P)-dependent dehydrogenase (short-subunit alcohol dehydrogenase family)